jgi:hypothetical protein
VLGYKEATGTVAGYIQLVADKAGKETYTLGDSIVRERYRGGWPSKSDFACLFRSFSFLQHIIHTE